MRGTRPVAAHAGTGHDGTGQNGIDSTGTGGTGSDGTNADGTAAGQGASAPDTARGAWEALERAIIGKTMVLLLHS